MPKKTSEKEELKEKKKTGKATTSSKSTAKSASKKQPATKSKSTSKKATTTSAKAGKKATPAKPKKTTTKANNSVSSKPKTASTKKSASKTAAPKTKATTTTKKTAEKVPETKKIEKVEKVGKVEKVQKEDEKIKEKTVIEKIKAFIAKIVAMQEEARLEAEAEKEEKAKSKKEKELKEKVEIKPTPYMLEYYDLPYRYNETVVKILAQTPKRLFVYWDISDKDREKYLMAFGERFFEETYPVLLIHNEDMNYTFEVPINDFANSWYLDINDSKSKYTIQLGRKFRQKPEMVNIMASTETQSVVLQNDYVPIITSNLLEVPNDHILFENIRSKVLYRNVKTGQESTIDIDNLEFAKRMGHIYSIYDIYKEIYKSEMDSESLTDLLNPSSMSSSKMSSSAFVI